MPTSVVDKQTGIYYHSIETSIYVCFLILSEQINLIVLLKSRNHCNKILLKNVSHLCFKCNVIPQCESFRFEEFTSWKYQKASKWSRMPKAVILLLIITLTISYGDEVPFKNCGEFLLGIWFLRNTSCKYKKLLKVLVTDTKLVWMNFHIPWECWPTGKRVFFIYKLNSKNHQEW